MVSGKVQEKVLGMREKRKEKEEEVKWLSV
jgi:hypothetical protein